MWTEKKTGTEHRPKARYFISSVPYPEDPGQLEALALRMGKQVRQYWGIENGQHWRRDVHWREDRDTKYGPRAAKAVALLRATVLSALQMRFARGKIPEWIEHFGTNTSSAIRFLNSKR